MNLASGYFLFVCKNVISKVRASLSTIHNRKLDVKPSNIVIALIEIFNLNIQRLSYFFRFRWLNTQTYTLKNTYIVKFPKGEVDKPLPQGSWRPCGYLNSNNTYTEHQKTQTNTRRTNFGLENIKKKKKKESVIAFF